MEMGHPTERTKQVDSKGRLNLGEAFANRTVIVEYRGQDEVVVKRARVIPEREAWLYQNPKALAAVRRGLAEAREKRFAATAPDLKSDAKLADSIQDEE